MISWQISPNLFKSEVSEAWMYTELHPATDEAQY
jgi:hypothetical protein